MTDNPVQRVTEEVIEAAKPRLRGWLHTGTVPVALVAVLILVALARGPAARWTSGLFAVASVALFATSAAYHRGRWSPRALGVWRRLDHANIFWIIAASYTPFAVLALDGPASKIILSVVWLGAGAGILLRIFWLDAPRWLYTGLYLVVGWTAVFVFPQLIEGAGVPATVLVGIGGLLYTAGGVVYALRRPNPSPRWFGFHEVFHVLTIAAWGAHYAAISLVVYARG